MPDAPGVTVPVVIDLGKTRRKRIKQLKRGRGKLIDETREVVEDLRASLGPEAAGKELVPVVIVYRKKLKKRRRRSLFPFLF
jgi:Family of unknown function (DUF6200)